MLFNQVVGLEGIKGKLRQMVQNSRLSHAILLTAAEGVGALPLALAFAQYLVCEKVSRRQETPESSSQTTGIEPEHSLPTAAEFAPPV